MGERISEGCLNWARAVIIFALLGGFDGAPEELAIGIGVSAVLAMFISAYLQYERWVDEDSQ